MLTIKAEGTPGCSLRNDMVPEMLNLARLTKCMVEVQANDTTFWVYPKDTIEELHDAYDRLYPTSQIVSVALKSPFVREKIA